MPSSFRVTPLRRASGRSGVVLTALLALPAGCSSSKAAPAAPSTQDGACQVANSCSCNGSRDESIIVGAGAQLVADSCPQSFMLTPDTIVLVTSTNQLETIPRAGGPATFVGNVDPQVALTAVEPTTRTAYGWAQGGALMAVPLDGSPPRTVYQLPAPRAFFSMLGIADGRLYYTTYDGTTYASASIALTEPNPQPVALAFAWNGAPQAAVSGGFDSQHFWIYDDPTLLSASRADVVTAGSAGGSVQVSKFSDAPLGLVPIALRDFSAPSAFYFSSSIQGTDTVAAISKLDGHVTQAGMPVNPPSGCDCNYPTALSGADGGVYYCTESGLFYLSLGSTTPERLSPAACQEVLADGPDVFFTVLGTGLFRVPAKASSADGGTGDASDGG